MLEIFGHLQLITGSGTVNMMFDFLHSPDGLDFCSNSAKVAVNAPTNLCDNTDINREGHLNFCPWRQKLLS